MWIYTKDAFFSVVENDLDANYLTVRARREEDIDKLDPYLEGDIERTPNRDYPYRAYVDRQEFTKFLEDQVDGINYENFKNTASKLDQTRTQILTNVWTCTTNLNDR